MERSRYSQGNFKKNKKEKKKGMTFEKVISIYAAVISTIVFFWRIFEFYYDRRGRLLVSMQIIEHYTSPNINEMIKMLEITITNIGKEKRVIRTPFLKSDAKKNRFIYPMFIDSTKFPHAIEPAERLNTYIRIEDLGIKDERVTKLKPLLLIPINEHINQNGLI